MATMTEKRIPLSSSEMAEMCGVTQGYISSAVHSDWLAGGVRVREYAVWHWKGNRVDHYEVPEHIAREHFPRDRWSEFGIDRY